MVVVVEVEVEVVAHLVPPHLAGTEGEEGEADEHGEEPLERRGAQAAIIASCPAMVANTLSALLPSSLINALVSDHKL